VIAPPAPPSKGHSRGRSIGDGSSISSRFSKATDRLRSASRGRKEAGKSSKAPEAPYESIPTPYLPIKSPIPGVPPPMMYDPDVIRSPIESKRSKHMSTGLHKSEMI